MEEKDKQNKTLHPTTFWLTFLNWLMRLQLVSFWVQTCLLNQQAVYYKIKNPPLTINNQHFPHKQSVDRQPGPVGTTTLGVIHKCRKNTRNQVGNHPGERKVKNGADLSRHHGPDGQTHLYFFSSVIYRPFADSEWGGGGEKKLVAL